VIPGTYDIQIYQGDTFRVFFRLRDEGGTYIDLTGQIAKAQIRSNTDAPTVLAEFSTSIPDQSVLANRGSVLLTLTSAQTSALTTGGVWDVQLQVTATGEVNTYLRGTVTVVKEVTRV
jgi:hypothetical protein